MKTEKFKSAAAIALAVMICATSLTACGSGGKKPSAGKDAPKQSQQVTPKKSDKKSSKDDKGSPSAKGTSGKKDDDNDIREGIRILLAGESYAILEAESGQRALELLNASVDLVILDVMMPGLSGLRVCEEIRKTSPVPILFLADIEYRILRLLMETPRKVFSIQNIYESIWNEPYYYISNGTVMVHIRKLRVKIEEAPSYDWNSYYEIDFADGPAEVVLYANDAFRWSSYLTTGALFLSCLLFLLIFLRGCRKIVTYICQLSREIQAMEGGDLDVPITVRGGHDLRTPLTALQIYTDILRFRKYDPGQLGEYLEKIDAKAAQIKQLSENIFEYSLISREQTVQLDPPAPFRNVFHDVLSEMAAYLGQRGFSFRLELDWPEAWIAVHPPYVKRLLDNLTSNLLKYADPAVPVLMEAGETEDGPWLALQNAVRPDGAGQESTQIGLANMRTMMEKMGGRCQVFHTPSSFRVELRFPGAESSRAAS